MKYPYKKRAVIIFWMFSLMLVSLTAHLAYIQVYSGQQLSQEALAQQSLRVGLEIPSRGQITDRNLIPLTRTRKAWRVVVFPTADMDKKSVMIKVAAVFNKEPGILEPYFRNKAGVLPWDLNPAQLERFRKFPISGVIAAQVYLRDRTPAFAGHIIGYTGKDEKTGQWEGKSGIEYFYNSSLRSSIANSSAWVFRDGKGNLISGLGYQIEENVMDRQRKNVVLTLDRDIQQIVEQVMDEEGILRGAIVITDIKTGDILAMASRPKYGLNNAVPAANVSNGVYKAGNTFDGFVNHCTALYQPGSVFKVIVAAAALEEGLVSPDEKFFCTGAKESLVKCYKKEGHGLITFSQATALSCNPTFARVGLRLGAQKLIEYSNKFGIGHNDIVGYPKNSLPVNLNNIAENHNLVNASIGQWPVEASAIDINAVLSAVANRGIYHKPRIVKEIRYGDNTIAARVEQPIGQQIFSEKTALTLQLMLAQVTEQGTGRQAMLEPWGSAGKTGSAQVGKNRINAWFSGYAPVRNPSYAATVLVLDGISGGESAAPIFKEVMQKILEAEKPIGPKVPSL